MNSDLTDFPAIAREMQSLVLSLTLCESLGNKYINQRDFPKAPATIVKKSLNTK